jgi:DNA-binding winged helix-turn-helix (wHTH) protein
MQRIPLCEFEKLTNGARVRDTVLGFHMDNGGHTAQIVRFGVFEADLQSGELHKNEVRVPLQGQPFQVCAILLSHSGELVTREELRQKVWPEDTFVDFEQALNTAIAKIRIALGDDANNPRFVETLPRRGYRFIGPVDKPNSRLRLERLGARSSWIAVGVTLFLLLSGVGIWRFSRKPAESLLPSLEVIPLVVLPGAQGYPVFSPDGNQVAFEERDGKNSGNLHDAHRWGEAAAAGRGRQSELVT